MSEDPEPAPAAQPEEPVAAEAQTEVDEQEMGDFITRHVLEKDSVFFEG